MKNRKTQIKNMIIFVTILIAIASYILPKELANLDELWIYTSAKNVVDGLLPYKDFNLITTPFLPIIAGIILNIFANELIVMRFLAILLGTSILFMMKKNMEKLNIFPPFIYLALLGMTLLLREHICLDYNFVNVFLILCMLYLEFKKIEQQGNQVKCHFFYDFFIGVLAGLSIGFKQTTGLMIWIVTEFSNILMIQGKKEWKEYGKIFGIRLLGSLIPISILAMYLTWFRLWTYFIDYAIWGVKEFANVIPITNLWKNSKVVIKILITFLPIILVYLYFTTVIGTKKKRLGLFYLFCYSVASCTVIIPISDEIHFLVGIIPAFIGLIYVLNGVIKWMQRKIKKEKVNLFMKEFITCTTILLILGFSYQNVKRLWKYIDNVYTSDQTFLHYTGIPISEGIYQRITTVENYIKQQKEKVYILDASAVIFKIPINQYDKHYDLFLKGNLGVDGQQKMIQDIQKLTNVKILIQKPPRNWQTPEEVIQFVEQNWRLVGEIDLFDIYER